MIRDEPLAVGQIKLYDDVLPNLASGAWQVQVSHDVVDGANAVNPQPFTATQEVIVTAPQFTISSDAVVATFPPDTSAGPYAEVLPHVVLADPLLPWEREIGAAGTPWLALLVLTDDEVIGGQGSPTRTQNTTVAGPPPPPPPGGQPPGTARPRGGRTRPRGDLAPP